MAKKLKINAAGWETFSGFMGQTEFKDGVSIDIVSQIEIDRLSATIPCIELDAETNADLGEAGYSARLVGGATIKAEVVEPLAIVSEEELDAERLREHESRMIPPHPIMTVAELQGIADKDGLKGLRVIGDKWNVKDRNIVRLIGEIVRAQEEFQSKVKKVVNEARTAASIAQKEALNRAAEDRAAFDAKVKTFNPATEQFVEPVIDQPAEKVSEGDVYVIDENGNSVVLSSSSNEIPPHLRSVEETEEVNKVDETEKKVV